MAKVPSPKAVEKSVYGPTKAVVTTKGAFGGGNKFNQMKPTSGFGMPVVKGHSQKANIKTT